MQNEHESPVVDLKNSTNNSKLDQEDPGAMTIIDNPIENEIISLDAVNEHLENDDFEAGTGDDPLFELETPADEVDVKVNSSDQCHVDDNHVEASDDEYVYMSNDECDDSFVDEDPTVDSSGPPGPKSKKRNNQHSDDNKAKELLETAIVIPISDKPVGSENSNEDQDHQTKTLGNGRRSSRILNKRTLNDNHPPATSNSFSNERSSRKSRRKFIMSRKLQSEEQRIPTEQEKNKKDFFGTPLNAPYVDSSSDEDYFQPLHSDKKTERSHHGTREKIWINNWTHIPSKTKSNDKDKRIPDDIYFNSKVPLHVLYSYGNTSSEEETEPVAPMVIVTNASAPPIRRTKHRLSKMPTVHKIEAKKSKTQSSGKKHPKETVFQQLNDLKRCFKASGIKISINELVKGCKTFHDRCERIRDSLHENGIRGRITLAKCKQLKKRLKDKKKLECNTNDCTNIDEVAQVQSDNVQISTNEPKPPVQIESSTDAEQREIVDAIKQNLENESCKCEENLLDPSNMVETIFDSNEPNVEALNQILATDFPNELIECSVDSSAEYFEQIRNI